VSAPVGGLFGSLLITVLVALALNVALVAVVSRRAPNILDSRFLLVVGAMFASLLGVVAYVLAMGMMFK